jgi:hypothetical protein
MERPVSLILLVLALVIFVVSALPAIRKSRETVFTE